MPETISADIPLEYVGDSFCILHPSLYIRDSNGDYEYIGSRPEGHWHAHGHFFRYLLILEGFQVRRVRLWKPRWLQPENRRTCHSRSPDEMGRISVCGLLFILFIQGLLESSEGIHSQEPAVAELRGVISPRTLQRWLKRIVPNGLVVQQDCRRAVMNKSEPRPVERLFPQGLSPPESIRCKTWQDPQNIEALWRGLTILFRGAGKHHTHTAILLAEARGRVGPEKRHWI